LTIGLNTVFKAIELPAGISGLDTGLAKMKRKNFTHIVV